MKKYLLYLLLLCSINAYSQSSSDFMNINIAERLLNSENVPLLSGTYRDSLAMISRAKADVSYSCK